MKLSPMLHALAGILASVNASPLFTQPLAGRDVIVPKITSPDADTVWTVGSTETVTWDTSDFPPDSQITNPIGRVVLGYDENDSLNLDLDHPLASGFKLRDGSVKIKVPNVKPRDDYLIVLFGDSGNTSPSFVITRISNSPKPPSSPSSVKPTTSGPTTANLLPSSTIISTPIPITGSVITGGTGSTMSSFTVSPSDDLPLSAASSATNPSGTLGASIDPPTGAATSLRMQVPSRVQVTLAGAIIAGVAGLVSGAWLVLVDL